MCAVIKQCKCGQRYTRQSWARLPMVARNWLGLQLRNCTCHSTLGLELGPTIGATGHAWTDAEGHHHVVATDGCTTVHAVDGRIA